MSAHEAALNVVHLSPTPLVGAPGKIAWAQRSIGMNASTVLFSDYPSKGPLAGKFTENSIVLSGETRELAESLIEEADIIQVHNFVPASQLKWLLRLNSGAAYVYHAHSPLREGPLYGMRGEFGLDYVLHLYVGQYAGRFYQDYIPVPNIVLDAPTVKYRQPDERLRVMFSPTHANPGRWNSKHSPELNQAIETLQKNGLIDLVYPEKPVHPNLLLQMRRSCHVSIDEIATGAFHQVSLEGLCAGNIVINRADYFSRYTFSGFSEGVEPPFLYADGNSIFNTLVELANSVEKTVEGQQRSHEYFKQYCNCQRMAEYYENAYETIL